MVMARSKLSYLMSLIFVTGCASSEKPSNEEVRNEDRKKIQDTLAEEQSLSADRKDLEDLRKEIPEETKKSNDELAFYLQMMRQGTEQPQNVRDKFQNLVRKRRNSYRDKVTKLRDGFKREETKRREDFLTGQKAKRDEYLKTKHDAKTTRDYFSEQEKDRQSFFADERERRSSFESELASQSKDFESYMKEKQNEFNEQYRLYSKKFSERPKEKKAVTGDVMEPKRLEDMPTEPLGTD